LNLAEGEMVINREDLDALHDELFVLACAVEDVERDLAASTARPSATELREMLMWLLEAARPIRDRESPSSKPSG
jgi:hypothetical protein